MWFQNRRAKFRRNERSLQSSTTSSSSSSSNQRTGTASSSSGASSISSASTGAKSPDPTLETFTGRTAVSPPNCKSIRNDTIHPSMVGIVNCESVVFISVDGLYTVGSWKASGALSSHTAPSGSSASPSSHHAAALALMQSSKSFCFAFFVRPPARFAAN